MSASASERAPIGAFWSYSRQTEEISDRLCQTLERALAGGLAPFPVKFFKDKDPGRGIYNGEPWTDGLVRGLCQATLFFWVQTPLWLNSDVCRLEFEAFRDRVERLASRQAARCGASIDAEKLWHALVTPVPLDTMSKTQWGHFPEAVRTAYHEPWTLMQRVKALNLPDLFQSQDVLDYGRLGQAVAPVIRNDLDRAADIMKTDLPGLLEIAKEPDETFARHWIAEFRRTLQSGGGTKPSGPARAPDREGWISRQQRAAARLNQGGTRRHIRDLDLAMILLPYSEGDDAFWVSAGPASGKIAAAAETLAAECRPQRTPSGRRLWPGAAVMAIWPSLRQCRLDVPDPRQAQALREIAKASPDVVEQLGFDQRPDSFWFHDGGLIASDRPGEIHPLYVVSQGDTQA